jgi:hypothetical protein
MALLICYTSDSRAYIDWLEKGRPDDRPQDIPVLMPIDSKKGDRYLLFVGGHDQVYFGWGKVVSNWAKGTGYWKGADRIEVEEHILKEAIPASDVFASTGFKAPRKRKTVDETVAAAVWSAARGKPLTPVDRAVEGILTESRSPSRNAGLRLAALQRAGGVCEGCGVNFGKKHDGLGKHCLVVHHKKQLKDTDQPRETKLSELATVCANCHMMIHANRMKALTLAQLKKKLGRH